MRLLTEIRNAGGWHAALPDSPVSEAMIAVRKTFEVVTANRTAKSQQFGDEDV
jgi:hypothetical protein